MFTNLTQNDNDYLHLFKHFWSIQYEPGIVLRTGDEVTGGKSHFNIQIAAMYVSNKILNISLMFLF